MNGNSLNSGANASQSAGIITMADEITTFKIPQNNFAVMDAVMIRYEIRENFETVKMTALFW